jgi:hypothetical protein
VQGIPRVVTIREISALQLKKCYRKGCQIFAAHTKETPKDKVPNLEDHEEIEHKNIRTRRLAEKASSHNSQHCIHLNDTNI